MKTWITPILCCLLLIAAGCGKKGDPVPQDKKNLFSWESADAALTGNGCLAISALMKGAARNVDGRVIMYADKITPAMRAAIDETERRRAIQTAYNEAHGIVPKTIKKSIRDLLEITGPAAKDERGMRMTERERKAEIDRLEKEMRKAAQMLEYEYAAVLRDQIIRLRGEK